MYSRDVELYWGVLWGVLLWSKHDITDGLEVNCTACPWVSTKQKLNKMKYLHIVCMRYECVQARTAVVLWAAASRQSGLNHREARRAAHRGLGAQVGIADCNTRTGDAVHCVWLWRRRNTHWHAAFTLTTVVPRAAAAGVVNIHSQNLSTRTRWNGLNAWLTYCSDKQARNHRFISDLCSYRVVKPSKTNLGGPKIPVKSLDTPPHFYYIVITI